MAAVLPPRPLAESDDRQSFDCGRPSLNIWFGRHALANHLSGASRVSVIADAGSGKIAGFVSLCAGQIARGFLAKARQRNSPDPIPVTLLGQLAVGLGHQGQGHAASLLFFALRTSLAAADVIGSVGVITHPLDEGVRRLYGRWGFEDLPFDPGRAMMVRMADLRKSFGGG